MIKKYNEFITEIKSGDNYNLGCVMLHLNIPNWKEIVSKISHDDIFKEEDTTKGIELYPHITILYGLKPSVSENDVRNILNKYNADDFNIEVDGIDIFENKECDVVKMNVKCDVLYKINNDLRSLPYKKIYNEYKPHITIAFVKKGEAKKYIDESYKAKINNIKFILYTKPDGSEYKFNI